MRRYAVLAGLFSVLYFAQAPRADEPLTDSELFYMMVGSWTVDHQQLDAIPHPELELREIETLNADGTATVTIFSDSTCKDVTRSMNFTWGVTNRIMIAKSTDGLVGSQDEILAIDKKTMTLRLIGGSPREVRQTVGIVEHRIRAINCATPE